MIFQEKAEMIEGSEIFFQIITLTNSYYIYVGDKRQNMNNLFFSIQTPYVDIIHFFNSSKLFGFLGENSLFEKNFG